MNEIVLDINLAVKIGVGPALLLGRLEQALVKKNIEWLQVSIKQWHVGLPFYSTKTILRIIATLEELELLRVQRDRFENFSHLSNLYSIN